MLRFDDPPRRWFAFRLGTTPPAHGDAAPSELPADDERAAHWADEAAGAEPDPEREPGAEQPPRRPFLRGR